MEDQIFDVMCRRNTKKHWLKRFTFPVYVEFNNSFTETAIWFKRYAVHLRVQGIPITVPNPRLRWIKPSNKLFLLQFDFLSIGVLKRANQRREPAGRVTWRNDIDKTSPGGRLQGYTARLRCIYDDTGLSACQ